MHDDFLSSFFHAYDNMSDRSKAMEKLQKLYTPNAFNMSVCTIRTHKEVNIITECVLLSLREKRRNEYEAFFFSLSLRLSERRRSPSPYDPVSFRHVPIPRPATPGPITQP